MNKISVEQIKEDFRSLGISKGDLVLLSADFGKIGYVGGSRPKEIRMNFLNALMDVVGEEGTIVTVTFTKIFNLYFGFDRSYIFDQNSVSTAGSLAKAFLEYPNVVRSTHPTCSFAAIGKFAKEILGTHTVSSLSYDPIGEIIKRGGKTLLVGCADYNNGFHVIHYVQQVLGLTSKNLLKNKLGVNYRMNNSVHLFKQGDFGGCSRGFFKFHSDFVANSILKTGFIGEAYSVMVPAKESYEIVFEKLAKEPKYALCEHKDCFSCRGLLTYNKKAWPKFYLFYFWKRVLKMSNNEAG